MKKRISITLSQEDYEKIKETAGKEKLKIPTWVRSKILLLLDEV